MIRSVTGRFDKKIFSLDSVFNNCPVFYNRCINLDQINFENIKDAKDLISRMEVPKEVPSIVVYYPTHKSFEMYDAIVATYDDKSSRKLYGYQLKEGRTIPTTIGDNNISSYVIRGKAAKKGRNKNNWNIASEEEIEEFLGETGKLWSPKKWKELKNDSTLSYTKVDKKVEDR